MQVISDLHLEFYVTPRLRDFVTKTTAKILCIAGDLGIPYLESYDSFLKECSEEYEKTFIITGNHEYYQHKNKSNLLTINDTNDLIKNITSKYNNIWFLNNDHHVLDDKKIILGTTLWTNIPEQYRYYAKRSMNDYKQSYYLKDEYLENITPNYTSLLHEDNVKWLKERLEEFKDKEVIIMTHHLPSFKMIAKKYQNNPINYCFATDLEDLLSPNIKYWISGHTHDPIDVKIKNVRCIVNPFGYKAERVKCKKGLVLDI
jgi:DNA repair exonuclease SbcCD nuclease subunit